MARKIMKKFSNPLEFDSPKRKYRVVYEVRGRTTVELEAAWDDTLSRVQERAAEMLREKLGKVNSKLESGDYVTDTGEFIIETLTDAPRMY